MTHLPETAPTVYARSQLGPRALDYIRRQGWLAGPRVTPRPERSPEIEAQLARLREGGGL